MLSEHAKQDALKWLAENEPKWGLTEPINKQEFLDGLDERTTGNRIPLQQGSHERPHDSNVGAKEQRTNTLR